MVNWKKKYLKYKLKYYKLKQTGGGYDIEIIAPGSGKQLYATGLSYNWNIFGDIFMLKNLSGHKAKDVIPILENLLIELETNYKYMPDEPELIDSWGNINSDINISEDDLLKLKGNAFASRVKSFLDKSYEFPDGYWMFDRGAQGIQILKNTDGVLIEGKDLQDILELPNPAAFCRDCDTQFSSRNKLFQHLEDNKCPNC
jgi:hypothetical protein